MHRVIAVLLYGSAMLASDATSADLPARSDAANPAAGAPALKYESAFANYRRYEDQPLRRWTEVNDEVAKAGGHIGIFRGAQGHGAHAAPTAPAQAPLGEGQPPVRGAPQAPAQPHRH